MFGEQVKYGNKFGLQKNIGRLSCVSISVELSDFK